MFSVVGIYSSGEFMTQDGSSKLVNLPSDSFVTQQLLMPDPHRKKAVFSVKANQLRIAWHCSRLFRQKKTEPYEERFSNGIQYKSLKAPKSSNFGTKVNAGWPVDAFYY